MTELETLPDANLLSQSRLILFESPGQIRSRPLWRDDLNPAAHTPVRILGGYSFAKTDWLACGMSSCRALHGSGYVVATQSGLETHIGHDCGKRLFNEDFADLERNFKRAYDAQSRKDILQNLLQSKDDAIVATKLALMSSLANQQAVEYFLTEINKESSLLQAFTEALRNDGQLIHSRRKTQREIDISGTQDRFVREPIGRLDGIAAVNFRALESDLKYNVLGPLNELTADSLAAASQKQLELKSKLVGELREKLRQAEEFSKVTKRFVRPSNWKAFEEVFADGRTRTTDRGRKILTRMIAKSSEV